MNDKVKGPRGRPMIISNEGFQSLYGKSHVSDDMVDALKTYGEQLQGQKKETFQNWVANKTTAQLKLYVSMRASQLRKKGVVLVNGLGHSAFKRGPFNHSRVEADEVAESVAEMETEVTNEPATGHEALNVVNI